ncbi:MAG: cellulose-binding protein [Cyanobacteria bacterium]|nr:cellulose-binding protein [Cyanobacteria bacterium CG_2015-16_32_12]NCO78840.1 cellulose-binding protein [Cyanobacteria bacterium CG_2015-22_32_23]NCQ04519.1 cellulose-binding protein [Cyanobacteria bacterium CG_2015-09_32_10]NCQ40451.1 cellulose-binding protein [Cyanobacteria bacterium CG_2015-04_32_10]
MLIKNFKIITLLSLLAVLISACQSLKEEAVQSSPVVIVPNKSNLPPQKANVGIGLNGIADWSTQLPFINHFKTSRAWITQCLNSEPDCQGKWSTEENKLLNLDENGWVKSLPKPEDPQEYTRVSTLLFRDIPNKFRGGKYLVLYDGEGTLEYKFAAKKIPSESKPGRDVIEVDSSSGGGILLTITATDPKNNGNYIRNIKVIEAKNEKLFNQGEIFNPLFLEKIKAFTTLRFMDWMQTNNSEQIEWSDRPTPNISSYALKGASVETMIALGNKLNKDVWFNIPHQATDEYMTKFAQLVKAKLNPKLKIYIEYSNEVWNWQFKQAKYSLAQGKAKWNQEGNAYMQWYGMRTAQMCDIWKKEFGDQKNRVICVISTQTAYKGREKPLLDCPLWVKEGNKPCYQHGIDAYAITGYFSGALGHSDNESKVKSWLNESDGGFNKAIEQLKTGKLLQGKTKDSLPDLFDLFTYHRQVAQERGLQLVAYEGGQHIVAVGKVQENEQLNNFFMELNRRPEMYDLYTEVLNNWEKTGGGLFMHFVDIGQPSKHGSWGSLEYLDQKESPKYNALMDFIRNHHLSKNN